MKIRIGYGLGGQASVNEQESFAHVVDELERLRFDSLWVSERLQNNTLDPMVAMTFAAARTTKLKFGPAVMVLPGRNPVLLAKSIASLDRVSNGRVLPAFGLGSPQAAEFQAFGVERADRAPWFNEALPLLRRLWSEDSVTHHGERFQLDDVRVLPKPVQDPIEVWLGGAAKSELRRCGRLGDGWMPSFCTPEIAAEGMVVVNQAAAEAEREIDDEHFGVLLPYVHGEVPDRMKALAQARQPAADIDDILATSVDKLHELIDRFVDKGFSKFIVFAVDEPKQWTEELEEVADRLLPLQN